MSYESIIEKIDEIATDAICTINDIDIRITLKSIGFNATISAVYNIYSDANEKMINTLDTTPLITGFIARIVSDRIIDLGSKIRTACNDIIDIIRIAEIVSITKTAEENTSAAVKDAAIIAGIVEYSTIAKLSEIARSADIDTVIRDRR
jgi:hypothetical protein